MLPKTIKVKKFDSRKIFVLEIFGSKGILTKKNCAQQHIRSLYVNLRDVKLGSSFGSILGSKLDSILASILGLMLGSILGYILG